MSDETRGWGPWCANCGHPATYHGMTFCTVAAGSSPKRDCDCDGYEPRRPNGTAAPVVRGSEVSS